MPVKKDNAHVLRLFPGDDLRSSIESFVKEKNIQAGWIVSCTGSLVAYSLRFAGQSKASGDSGLFEIVSLTGTVSINGSHLHVALSDNTGKTTGGHLMSGCKIYTTAEIVLVESAEYIFKRENDGSTPWQELQIEKK